MTRATIRSMSRRTLRLGGASLLLTFASVMSAQPAGRHELLLPLPAEASLITILERLAAIDEAGSRETTDGVEAPMGSMEVVVARIGTDGQVSYACLDSAAGVRRALQTAPPAHATGKARE
jgi:hypothetical protein